jgi:hypothetical protein
MEKDEVVMKDNNSTKDDVVIKDNSIKDEIIMNDTQVKIEENKTDEVIMKDSINKDTPIEIQKKIFIENEKFEAKLNDKNYLVEEKWFKKFKSFLEDPNNNPKPGEVDNSVLVKTTEMGKNNEIFFTLKILSENTDYIIVNQNIWNLIENVYGGGPKISRLVKKRENGYLFVDITPIKIYVTKFDKNSPIESPLQFNVTQISKSEKIKTLKPILKDFLSLTEEEFKESRIWLSFRQSPNKLLADEENDVFDYISDGDEIIIEIKDGDSYPFSNEKLEKIKKESSYASSSSYSYYSGFHGDGKSSVPGVCGLGNLGNTCFMVFF